MIRIESLQNAIERIDAINSRFGVGIGHHRPLNDGSFARELAKAEERLDAKDGVKPVDMSDFSDQASTAHQVNEVQRSVNEAVANMSDTSAMIMSAAQKYNVDPRLLNAVAETESGGNQDAVSPVGAIGVMQLMPETAAYLGVNPYDKQQNIEGGAKYIRQMLDTFGGDVQKAVAAYNAGPQAVKDYGGIPPYRETQNYVNKVMDIYW